MLCTDAGVDFRASCFCHKVSIHLGQLCFPAFAPLILSISAQLHCNTHTALSATVVQTKSKLRAMPSGLACKALRAYTAIVDFCCTSCFLPSTYARCLTLLGLHCRRRLTWDMYAQYAYPYSARWELPVSCRYTSKCTHYNDRISLLSLPTCTGQGIPNACFHAWWLKLLCLNQRKLCLCRNCQSVRHVGLLSMLLSRLSQLAALCHEEPASKSTSSVHNNSLLLCCSQLFVHALLCVTRSFWRSPLLAITQWWCTSWLIQPDAYQDCANMSSTPFNALFRCVCCFVGCVIEDIDDDGHSFVLCLVV